MLFAAPVAQAAPSTFTVDSLSNAGDANAGDGACATADGTCTLTAALEEANAATDTTPISIDFSVTGSIEFAGTAEAMLPGVNIGTQYAEIGNGAQLVIDSAAPVSIDFTGIDDVTQTDDTNYAMFYIASDDVSLTALGNVRAGAAGAAIAGSNVTLDAVNFSDNDAAIQEVGVAFLDGADNVNVQNAALESAWWSNFMVDWDATVSNISVDNVTSRGVEGYGHISFENDAVVNGFSITDSTFGNESEMSPKPLFYLNAPGNTITGLTLVDSSFVSPGQDAFSFEGGTYTLTDTLVQGSTFTGIGQFIEGGISSVDFEGLTVTGNTFTDTAQILDNNAATFRDFTFADNTVTRNTGYVLNLGNSTATGVSITGNTITDVVSGGGHTVVWLSNGDPDAGNVIDGNRFAQTGDAQTNLWAIWNQAVGIDDGANTGWTITNNHIDGYQPGVYSPIANGGVGQTVVTGNTFGPNSNGTTDTDSEWDVGYFVTNNDQANDRIQTWRPTEVVTDGTEAEIAVAPVNPALTNNTDPTSPVTLHVYWTAGDTAEEYIGSVSDVSAATTITVPTTHTDGFFRVQTVDANGNSSQYSGLSDEATEAPVTGTASIFGETCSAPQSFDTDNENWRVVSTINGTTVVTGPTPVDWDGDQGNPPGSVTSTDIDDNWTELWTPELGANGYTTDYSDLYGETVSFDYLAKGADYSLYFAVASADGTTYWYDFSEQVGVDEWSHITVPLDVTADGWHTAFDNNTGPTGAAPSAEDLTQALSSVDRFVVSFEGVFGADTTWFDNFGTDCAEPQAPAAPEMTETDEETATGTGEPSASVVVRDADGNVVSEASVDADGTWSVDGLVCGTTYTVVQVVDGVESDATEFTTADCPVAPTVPDAPAVTDTTDDGAAGTGDRDASVVVRDADGNVVSEASVDADGTWSVDGLVCGTTYTVVQVVDGVESDATEFTTADCADSGSNGDSSGGNLAETGFDNAGAAMIAAVLLLFGGAALVLARLRRDA